MIVVNMLRDYIQSLPAASGYQVFREFMPDENNCIAVFSTGGFPGDYWLKYDNPTYQVRVRNTVPTTAADTANSLYNELNGLHTLTMSGIFVSKIVAMQSGPINIGRDEDKRQEYTLNFIVRYRNDAAIHRI
jgi:hypothetical protein